MERPPIVDVVEVDCSGAYRAVIGDAVGLENVAPGFIGVNVSKDGRVVFVDRRLVEFHAGLLFDPGLELGITRLGFDKRVYGRFVQMEGGENHRVIPFSDSRVIVVEFALGFEGGLLPEAR